MAFDFELPRNGLSFTFNEVTSFLVCEPGEVLSLRWPRKCTPLISVAADENKLKSINLSRPGCSKVQSKELLMQMAAVKLILSAQILLDLNSANYWLLGASTDSTALSNHFPNGTSQWEYSILIQIAHWNFCQIGFSGYFWLIIFYSSSTRDLSTIYMPKTLYSNQRLCATHCAILWKFSAIWSD